MLCEGRMFVPLMGGPSEETLTDLLERSQLPEDDSARFVEFKVADDSRQVRFSKGSIPVPVHDDLYGSVLRAKITQVLPINASLSYFRLRGMVEYDLCEDNVVADPDENGVVRIPFSGTYSSKRSHGRMDMIYYKVKDDATAPNS